MVSNTLRLGAGIIVLAAVTTAIYSISGTIDDPVKAIFISFDNLVEIEEEIKLDEYGFNRSNAEVREGRVKRNESLYLILRDLDVSPQVIYEINEKSKGVFRSNLVIPGQRYIIYTDQDSGVAQRLVLHSNILNYVVFDWNDEVSVTPGKKEVETKIAEASGVIESSLYETLIQQDQNSLIGNHLSEIFAWQVDFFRLYPGDSYKVIYEEEFVDGKPIGIGRVLAAEFTSKNIKYDAFWYESDNKSGYFDSEGNGVQKALMKAPFKYSQRVSSNFSHSRFHPVLKTRTPHYGVDYAAPLGTPVLSVGDGEVVEAQYRGPNGNIVKIRHNSTYTTAYLHLNGFARGIKRGAKVKQGQVIGYVGRTGRVTGVHLDYRIYKNGHPVNPLKVELPPSKGISTDEVVDFKAHIEKLEHFLNQLKERETNIAAL